MLLFKHNWSFLHGWRSPTRAWFTDVRVSCSLWILGLFNWTSVLRCFLGFVSWIKIQGERTICHWSDYFWVRRVWEETTMGWLRLLYSEQITNTEINTIPILLIFPWHASSWLYFLRKLTHHIRPHRNNGFAWRLYQWLLLPTLFP